jgi:hypothetical protein
MKCNRYPGITVDPSCFSMSDANYRIILLQPFEKGTSYHEIELCYRYQSLLAAFSSAFGLNQFRLAFRSALGQNLLLSHLKMSTEIPQEVI